MGSNKRISLERLQPKFEMLIRNWVEDRKDQGMNFGILADMVGVHPTHRIDYGFEITNSNRISTSSLRSGVMPCLGAHFFATNLFIEDSFPPCTRPVLGAARQFFNQITTAASDACEFRSPTSSRGDNGVVGLTPWHSVRAPLRSHVPLAGRVMSAVYPPSCGASIGGVPRFTICEVR